jgi:hypothetical protein
MTSYIKFHQNLLSSSKIKICREMNGQTYMISAVRVCVQFMHIVQRMDNNRRSA